MEESIFFGGETASGQQDRRHEDGKLDAILFKLDEKREHYDGLYDDVKAEMRHIWRHLSSTDENIRMTGAFTAKNAELTEKNSELIQSLLERMDTSDAINRNTLSILAPVAGWFKVVGNTANAIGGFARWLGRKLIWVGKLSAAVGAIWGLVYMWLHGGNPKG